MAKLNLVDECLFCRASRDWHSELWIMSNRHNDLFKVTVCEKCRKNPKIKLYDLYCKIPEKIRILKKESR
jgi:hypothetical protein